MDWPQNRHNEIIKYAGKLLEECRKAQAEVENLRSQASGIQKIEQYPNMPELSRSPVESKRKLVNEWFAECTDIAKRNDAACEHNRTVYSRAVALMKSLGLEEEECRNVGTRRRKMDWVRSGWLVSLDSQIPTTHGFAYCEERRKGALRSIDEEEAKAAEAEQKREREAAWAQQAEEKARRKQRTIVAIAERYGCDPLTATVDDLRDAILAKDKYANLAYWMERNRGDWSEGPDFASIGLREFTISLPVDQEIHDDIQHHIEHWDQDGRIFRDCEWNYGRVMSLADAQVQKDLASILEFEERP